MSLFDVFRQDNNAEPVFIKETNSAEQQLNKLNELLLNTADIDIRKNIEQDIKMVQAGISGENNIAYELKSSFMPILIFHDLYLKYKDLTAQIDYLVIHKNFILVIECKKMLGDIEINAKGDFIRHFKTNSGKVYKKEGIYSPIVQNKRHIDILKSVLLDLFPKTKSTVWDNAIKSIVVIANPKSLINDKYAKKEMKNQIIKFDQLKEHLKLLENQNKDLFAFKNDSMTFLSNKLLELNVENSTDYTQKYFSNITDSLNNEKVNTNNTNIQDSLIYKDLKQYRYDKSKSLGIKPYFIYNNAQLEQIINLMPKDIEMLMSIDGFAEVKCQKYGNDILEIINKYKI